MKPSRKRFDRLEEMLKSAYHEKANADIPGGDGKWETGVMRRIRTEDLARSGPDFYSMFNEFVWRLAPVSAVMIIALTICMARVDMASEFEMAARMLDNIMDFNLDQAFNFQTG